MCITIAVLTRGQWLVTACPITQRRLTHDGEHHFLHHARGLRQGGLRHAIEHPGFRTDAFEVVQECFFDLAFRLRADAVDQVEQEVDQGIGEFTTVEMAKRCQKSQPQRLGMAPEFVRGFHSGTVAIGLYHFRCERGKEVGGQRDGTERANLGPVLVDGAAVPIIGAPLLGRYPHLRRQVGHRGGGNVLGPLGKVLLALKELQ